MADIGKIRTTTALQRATENPYTQETWYNQKIKSAAEEGLLTRGELFDIGQGKRESHQVDQLINNDERVRHGPGADGRDQDAIRTRLAEAVDAKMAELLPAYDQATGSERRELYSDISTLEQTWNEITMDGNITTRDEDALNQSLFWAMRHGGDEAL